MCREKQYALFPAFLVSAPAMNYLSAVMFNYGGIMEPRLPAAVWPDFEYAGALALENW